MKLIYAIIFALLSTITASAYADENFALYSNTVNGSVENISASQALDNVSTILNTDSRGVFFGEFIFNPTSTVGMAEFDLRIAFSSAGRYRFYVQKSNGRWERIASITSSSNVFQTLSLSMSDSLSGYSDNGFVKLRMTTSKRTTGMRLDYLALTTVGIQTPLNNSPIANDIQIETTSDSAQTIDVLNSTFDADSDQLSVSISAQAQNGRAVLLADSSVRYTPNPGFAGTDSFDYSVDDGKGGIATAKVSVTVNQENIFDEFVDIPLVSRISHVQPMTGIVLWSASHNSSLLKTSDEYTQLEYSYINPAQIVTSQGVYDWSSVEAILNKIEGRAKQAVLRLSYVLPGQQTKVPNYIKALSGYNETSGLTEGQRTYFPDWSNATLQAAHLDLYTAFAARYDDDPRLAFLQIGFGLWGEYHIYQPGVRLGVNFPSMAYQASVLDHASNVFDTLQWSLSIDAGSDSVSPLYGNSGLLGLNFGLFDDSFLHQNHSDYNETMWNRFDYSQRYETAVLGGEINYYTLLDQQQALNPAGIHGTTFAEQSAKFHITYMLGNDQPSYQSNERIRDAGLHTGYRFEVTDFQANSSQSRVTVRNNGVAPIYYDAHVSVNGILSNASLKDLLPGQSAVFTIESGGIQPVLSIESNRLVSGQRIEFDANL